MKYIMSTKNPENEIYNYMIKKKEKLKSLQICRLKQIFKNLLCKSYGIKNGETRIKSSIKFKTTLTRKPIDHSRFVCHALI